MSQRLNASKNFWVRVDEVNSGQYDELPSPPQQNHVEGILANWKSPGGLGVAVVKGGDDGGWYAETKGYGYATLGGSKVSEDTLFCISSNSKLFNVLATGLLISNESLVPRISWDTRIADIVPEWELRDPDLPRDDLMYSWMDDIHSLVNTLASPIAFQLELRGM
ncbi:uncharacterized protein BT62DRAFT_629619 [Guyanagaster necrorhizus]|uniref:Beta-lactamase-related domain-containing protein n=1 Tax=Guyanagaster necrorhizus TaxID=856835 RepID=A0A9P7VGW6_9AGAR|nr:uncharacterized protein BT62DRAFT_629619 [Guyanagaster necrorhizus MCA 3950]KAG7440335.1 hypothetical protein BT62DRAFT_629619 [Guyanagaster necrorhizus MCA 3950]